MNIEPDIFDYLETTSLEPHDDYTSEISYKDQKIIWNRLKTQQNEIDRLNNIINTFEEDLENVKMNLRYSGVKWDNDCLIRAEVIQQVLHKLKELKESVK